MLFLISLLPAFLARGTWAFCGAPHPPAFLLNEAHTISAHLDTNSTPLAYDPIRITTHVHVILSHEYSSVPDKLYKQMDVINAAYLPWNIQFNLTSVDYTLHPEWAESAMNETLEYEMKSSLRKGSYHDLNLYIVDAMDLGVLGYCRFPENPPNEVEFAIDGCVVLASTLPGGASSQHNLGGTLVHEIGHWFGLFHVFQGGCYGSGDGVADTPAQDTPTWGCPKTRDTCPQLPGLDNIHNYMDYSADYCFSSFTPGQAARMHAIFDTYRKEL